MYLEVISKIVDFDKYNDLRRRANKNSKTTLKLLEI